MTSKDDKKINFLKNNRRSLWDNPEAPNLIVLTANSLLQASADRAYPFVQESNFFYLTGLDEPGLVLVLAEKEEYLILPKRNQVREIFEGAVDASQLSHVSGIEKVYEHEGGWDKLRASLESANKVGILEPPDSYIESADMFTNPSRSRLKELLSKESSQIEFVDLRKQLATARMVKTDYEIKMIKKAIDETLELLNTLDKVRLDAVSEADLMAVATQHVIKNDQKFAFDPIIASGGNAVTLHYVKNNDVLRRGQLLLLDIGLKAGGYSADLTRTVSSKPTDRQKQVYDAVAEVQDYAISLLKPGLRLKEYEEKVVTFMGAKLCDLGLIKNVEKEEIRKFYPHSTSHFLGIDTHDTADYQRPLEAGMILTVEPGIYIKDEAIGIRLEDDVLITNRGNEVLSSKLPRNIASLTIAP